jgi:hypothetical protein
MSESTFPTPLKKTNYLSKDFLTLRDELLSKLPLITKGRWSNLNESDPGVAMLETFISAVDNLLFYVDMQGQEMDLDRARQRVNVIKLLRLIGYETRGVSASKGSVTIQVSPSSFPSYPVQVPKGTQVSAQGAAGAVVFTTTDDLRLGAGDVTTVSVVQGVSNTASFLSDGTPTQKFLINAPNVDKLTLEIRIDEDPINSTTFTPWLLVNDFYNSIADSLHYKIQIDEFSRVYIIFGDGQFGKIPLQNAAITVTFIQTDGENGNIGQNAIQRVISSILDANSNKVDLLVVNSEATAGGSSGETIEEAKTTALGLLYGLNRAISRNDYEALAESLPNVTKARAWGESEEKFPDYRLFNRVRVTFFSKEFIDMYFNLASRASYRNLRDDQVRALLVKKMPVTTRLVFIDPQFIDIFLTINVGIDTSNYDPAIVLDQIRSNILDYFNIEQINFGQDVRVSTILSLVNAIEGIEWAQLIRMHTTPDTQFPDTAPVPPLDITLEKWKIPIFFSMTPTDFTPIDVSAPTDFPYIKLDSIAASFNIGQNDVKVANPDEQTDILANGYTFLPGANLEHILLTYVPVENIASQQSGFYGDPNPESDPTTYSSIG